MGKQDSLERLLESATGIQRVNTILELCRVYVLHKKDVAKVGPLATISLKQSKAIGYHEGTIQSLLALRAFHSHSGNWQTELECVTKAKSQLNPDDPPELTSSVYHAMSNTLLKIGNIEAALRHQTIAIQLVDSAGLDWKKAPLFSLMGSIVAEAGNTEKAEEYYRKALEAAELQKDSLHMGVAYQNLGALASDKEEYVQGIELLKYAAFLFKRSGADRYMVDVLISIGFIKAKLQDYNEALKHYNEALLENPGREAYCFLYTNIGLAWSALGNYDLALTYLDSAEHVAAIENFNMRKAWVYESKSEIYEQLGNYPRALKFARLYNSLRDSLIGESIQEKIAKTEVRYDMAAKNAQITALKKEKNLQKKLVYLQLSLGLLGGVVIVWMVIIYYKKRQRKLEDTSREHQMEVLRLSKKKILSSEFTDDQNISMETFPVNSGSKILLKKLEELVYFHAESRLVFAVDRNGTKNVVDSTLAELQEILPSAFIRIHRSYIINKKAIRSIERLDGKRLSFTVSVEGGFRIQSSRSYHKDIKKELGI